MTALVGINCAPDADPAALAATGAKWVRLVYRDHINYRPWLLALQAAGVDCLFIGDSSPDSLGEDENQWAGRMTVARSNYGDLLKTWQWGNEPDGTGIASWRMSQARVNRLLTIARAVFPAGQYTLLAPGMVSGAPSWLNDVNLSLVDAIDAHPYAKFIDTPGARAELNFMLQGYLAFGKPLWCTEYDSRTLGLTAYLRDRPGVERVATMCWTSEMTTAENLNLGLLENPGAMTDFVAAAGGHWPPATIPLVATPTFVLGFKDWATADPALIGFPLENERGGVTGLSVQRTSKGRLMASNLVGRGWTLTFWDDATNERWLFEQGRSVKLP